MHNTPSEQRPFCAAYIFSNLHKLLQDFVSKSKNNFLSALNYKLMSLFT